MSNLLKEFIFETPPKNITYFDKEPLKLTNEFVFFHNKNKFRKELNRLQYLFKSYTKVPLNVAGIRDSYLKEENSNKYLIVLFTTSEVVKRTDEIIESYPELKFNLGCFQLEATTNYLLLLTKDMDGLIFGINTMEEILTQVLENYFKQQKFDEYIKICPFKLKTC